ncbi:DNA polymerase delta catalytic subunit [Tanacetum coccineum]
MMKHKLISWSKRHILRFYEPLKLKQMQLLRFNIKEASHDMDSRVKATNMIVNVHLQLHVYGSSHGVPISFLFSRVHSPLLTFKESKKNHVLPNAKQQGYEQGTHEGATDLEARTRFYEKPIATLDFLLYTDSLIDTTLLHQMVMLKQRQEAEMDQSKMRKEGRVPCMDENNGRNNAIFLWGEAQGFKQLLFVLRRENISKLAMQCSLWNKDISTIIVGMKSVEQEKLHIMEL